MGPSAAILSVLEIVVPGAVGVLVIGDEMAYGILPGVILGLAVDPRVRRARDEARQRGHRSP